METYFGVSCLRWWTPLHLYQAPSCSSLFPLAPTSTVMDFASRAPIVYSGNVSVLSWLSDVVKFLIWVLDFSGLCLVRAPDRRTGAMCRFFPQSWHVESANQQFLCSWFDRPHRKQGLRYCCWPLSLLAVRGERVSCLMQASFSFNTFAFFSVASISWDSSRALLPAPPVAVILSECRWSSVLER